MAENAGMESEAQAVWGALGASSGHRALHLCTWYTETPQAKAQGVLAKVPPLLLFPDGSVALDGRSQGF